MQIIVQGISEETIYIFNGVIELLWTSIRNHENEPVECLEIPFWKKRIFLPWNYNTEAGGFFPKDSLCMI